MLLDVMSNENILFVDNGPIKDSLVWPRCTEYNIVMYFFMLLIIRPFLVSFNIATTIYLFNNI